MSINIFNNINKNIFIGVLFAIIVFVPFNVKAELGDLDVVFSKDPLFQEISILPGDDANETITITNNSVEEKTIGIEFIGTSTFELDHKILFEILIDGNIINAGPSDPKSLADLLNKGEISIDNIQPAETKILSINADFPTIVGNPYQLKSSVFNIQVGYIYFETNELVPIVLGDEIEIKEPLETKKPTILGIELPITGGQLLLIFIVALILLIVTVITLRFGMRTKNSK